jgi:hypothetical protein
MPGAAFQYPERWRLSATGLTFSGGVFGDDGACLSQQQRQWTIGVTSVARQQQGHEHQQ